MNYFLSILLSVLFFFACASKKVDESVPVVTQQVFHVHTVSFQGETLSLISLWYTGKIQNWSKILDFNQSLEVTKIKIGDKINIPVEILKTSESLPKEFIDKHTKKAKIAVIDEQEAESIPAIAESTESSSEVLDEKIIKANEKAEEIEITVDSQIANETEKIVESSSESVLEPEVETVEISQPVKSEMELDSIQLPEDEVQRKKLLEELLSDNF